MFMPYFIMFTRNKRKPRLLVSFNRANQICSGLLISFLATVVLLYFRSDHDKAIFAGLSRVKNPLVVVSYAIYVPPDTTSQRRDVEQCLSNLRLFLLRGVEQSDHVVLIFSLIGDTPSSLTTEFQNVSSLSNVIIRHARSALVDLEIHGDVIRTALLWKQTRFFVCLNCGVRGPYFNPYAMWRDRGHTISPFREFAAHKFVWLTSFISKLNDSIKAVGSTVSCEQFRHVQSYFVTFDRIGAAIAEKQWRIKPSFDRSFERKLSLISKMEVGLSTKFSALGFSVSAVRGDCDESTDRSVSANPTVCRLKADNSSSIGCIGLDPCDQVMVKYGGEALWRNLISEKTKYLVSIEDVEQCGQFVQLPLRPSYNYSDIYTRLVSQFLPFQRPVIDKVSFVIVVRFHPGYIDHTTSFLYNLYTQTSYCNCTFLVYLLNLEPEKLSSEVLRRFRMIGSSKLLVRVSNLPTWIYAEFGHILPGLCTPLMTRALKQYTTDEHAHRSCKVNSPLHYYLVDIFLFHIKKTCLQCEFIIVTNGDNLYSYSFFKSIIKASNSTLDIIFTDFIDKGVLVVPSELRRSYIDLGGFALKVDFLRKWNLSFLESLPHFVNAAHYHDADGYFVERVVSHKAQSLKILEYMYYHE